MYVVLSMDMVFPFYGDMGLEINGKKFRSELKEIILADRLRSIHDKRTEHEIIIGIDNEIFDLLDEDDRIRFFQWKSCLYSSMYDDHLNWLRWQLVLKDLIKNKKFENYKLLFKNKIEVLVSKYKEATNMDEVNGKIEYYKKSIMSEWDLAMFAKHGFSLEDEYYTPFRSVIYTIELYRFKNYFKSIVNVLDAGELNNLFEVGGNIMKIQYLKDPEMINFLHPNQLLAEKC